MSRYTFRYRSEAEALEWGTAIEEEHKHLLVEVYRDARSNEWIVDVRSGHELMRELCG
jgi:hypothetical protein